MEETGDTAAFTVRLPKPLHAWLRRYCSANGVKMSWFVASAIESKRAEIEQTAASQR